MFIYLFITFSMVDKQDDGSLLWTKVSRRTFKGRRSAETVHQEHFTSSDIVNAIGLIIFIKVF